MNSSRISIAIITSLLVFANINTFASFNDDYKDFIIEVVKHAPSKQSFNPNMVNGSLIVSYDVLQDEKMSVDATVTFTGQVDKVTNDVEVSLSASGSYATDSGVQYVDMAGQSVIISNQWWISKLYVTLDRFKSNIPQLQDETMQSIISKLISNWYVWTGESDWFWVDNIIPQWSFVPSIAGDSIESQVKLYQQIIKYPIITPIEWQSTGSIYTVMLNKRNMANVMTVLTSSTNLDMTASDRNDMRRQMYREMSWIQTRGTFDPATNHIKLKIVDDWLQALVQITPQSIDIASQDTNTESVVANLSWDRDMISLTASGSMDSTAFTASMNATNNAVEVLWSYKDEGSIWSMSLKINTESNNNTVLEPKDALPLSDLQL